MDFFEKIKKIFQIQELGEKRIKQLQEEKKMDKTLSDNYCNCPELIFSYVMKTRELNRKLSSQAYASNVLDYPEQAQKNLEISDAVMLTALQPCLEIPKMMKDINHLLENN